MINAYTELKDRHGAEINAFPMFFAFDMEQFNEGMRKFGLDPSEKDKIYKFGNTGGFYLRSDADRLREMFDRHDRERQEAIDADTTGEGFIYQMFRYELNNYEYGYTLDESDTLDALGYSPEDFVDNVPLRHGLAKAKKEIREAD